MELRIEPCTRADFDFILQNMTLFWGTDRPASVHHPIFIEELSRFALAVRDQQNLVGYHFGFVVDDQARFYTHLVAVQRGYRKRGVGTLLYDHVETACRELELRQIKVITEPKNARSIAFHSSRGFRPVDDPAHPGLLVRKNYSGPGRDMVVMIKRLDA